MMIRIILRNILYYWRKTIVTVFLAGIVLSIGVSSTIFTVVIKDLVDRPLKSLQTEIILQIDTADKNPTDIKTSSVIQPFNLQSFSKNQILKNIPAIPDIKNVSTALVLWQFDIKNNITIVALDVNEPKVGLRNIETMIMPGGRFFTGNAAQEVILERHFATLFGYKLNHDYFINGKPYKIVGLVDFQEQSNLANAQVFIPYATALQILGVKDPIINQTFISLQSASSLPKVEEALSKNYPSYSVISKDSLLKNLSGLNQMFYRFGTYFNIVMLSLSLLLVFAVLRLHFLEYAYQTKLLQTLGWPKAMTRRWVLLDSLTILLGALVFVTAFSMLLYWQLPALIKLGPLLNYNLAL